MRDMIISILTDFALLESGTDEIKEVATQIVDFETDLSQVIYCLLGKVTIYRATIINDFKVYVYSIMYCNKQLLSYRYGLILPHLTLTSTQWHSFTTFGLM